MNSGRWKLARNDFHWHFSWKWWYDRDYMFNIPGFQARSHFTCWRYSIRTIKLQFLKGSKNESSLIPWLQAIHASLHVFNIYIYTSNLHIIGFVDTSSFQHCWQLKLPTVFDKLASFNRGPCQSRFTISRLANVPKTRGCNGTPKCSSMSCQIMWGWRKTAWPIVWCGW